MQRQLDWIENRLRDLIEHNLVTWLPQNDSAARFSKNLFEVIRQNLTATADGKWSAAGEYMIKVNPQLYDAWQQNYHYLQDLSHALAEFGLENGIDFASQPVIQVSADSDLAAHEIRILAIPRDALRMDSTAMMPSSVFEETTSRPTSAYLIVNGSEIFPLNQIVVNIGRKTDNHLVIEDPCVSRYHAQIRNTRGQFIIFDLNSTGGTFINGERILREELKPGDVISLGGVELIYGVDNQTDQTDHLPAVPEKE
jgi:hypothetical protein